MSIPLPAPLEPQAAIKLTDELLATFYEVEKLIPSRDIALIAALLASARTCIEEAVTFDFPIRCNEDDNLSLPWLSILMGRDIRQLSALKSRILNPSSGEHEMEKPVPVFLCILLDVCSLLATTTVRGLLNEKDEGSKEESPP